MSRKSILVPVLAGALILGGCNGGATGSEPKPDPGVLTVEADISASTPFMVSEPYANAAIKRVGDAVLKQRLGDRFRIVPIGSRTAQNAIGTSSIASGQKLHLSTVRKRIEGALTAMFAQSRRNGGDGNTNIVYTLENSHPVCNPDSDIIILSDGIESNEQTDAGRDLAAGRPVVLPKPSQRFLKGGCSISMIGIGVSSPTGGGADVQTLPPDQLDKLTDAWRAWFIVAGADPDKVHFETIL